MARRDAEPAMIAGHDRRRECHPMILSPGWPQRCPRAVQHLLGSLTKDSDRLALYVGNAYANLGTRGSPLPPILQRPCRLRQPTPAVLK